MGWPLVLHGGYANRSEFPLCGKTTLRAKRRAARSYRQLRSCPSPPLGCGRSPPYLRLVAGVRLAHPGSSLAEATFAPAQPPFIVNELLGEKTNLTQKKPTENGPSAPRGVGGVEALRRLSAAGRPQSGEPPQYATQSPTDVPHDASDDRAG